MELNNEIWFVDDDKVFQFIIQKYLADTKYENQYAIFDDGDKALLEIINRARKGKALPRIIFLDLNMQYMEGWETLDFLRETVKDTKVAIITSSLSEKDRARASRDPLVHDYITKPIERNQLLVSIRKLLNATQEGKAAS